MTGPALKLAERSHAEPSRDALPPHSLEAEMATLGSMILDTTGAATGAVAQILPDGDSFYGTTHGEIFEAIRKTVDQRGVVDLVLLSEELKRRDTLDQVGGTDYLLNLAQSVPSAASAAYYAEIVREFWIQRQSIDLTSSAWHFLSQPGADVPGVLADLIADTDQLAAQASRAPMATAGSIAGQLREDALEGREEPRIPLGFPTLDRLLDGGPAHGDMFVVGARPSVGKSAFMVQAAMQAAKAGARVGIVSLEMSERALTQRMLGFLGVGRHNLRSTEPSVSARVDWAVARLGELDVRIADLPGGRISDVLGAMRSLERQGCHLIAIDYAQLIQGDEPGMLEYPRVTLVSQSVKALSRKLGIVSMLLAQINRGGAAKAQVTMSDLKGSGSLEQDADQIILLNAPDEDHPYHRLHLAKHRNGATGCVAANFNGAASRFTEMAEYDQ